MRADAQRNRARVLEAAKDAFAAEGLGVPLDDIARRAGVGAGTVYRHFPTKEALFEAVMLDRMRNLAEHASALADADDPGAAFFDFLRRMVTGAASSRDLADALVGKDLSNASLITTAKAELHRAGAALLTRAQQAGAVRSDLGVAGLMTLLTATTVALQENPADTDIVVAVLCDGLRARSPG
jgi:AcrR family transcriptional regulator